MKTYKIGFLIVIILTCLFFAYDYQKPITIINDPMSVTKGFIHDFQSLEDQVYKIPESMSDELYDILSRYDTKRMKNPYPYQSDKMDLEYNFQDGERSMHLVLGEDNFIYEASKNNKYYEIINGADLKRELKHWLMKLDEYERHHTAYLYKGTSDIEKGKYKEKGQITWYGDTRKGNSGEVYFDGTLVLNYFNDLPMAMNELEFSMEIGKSQNVPLKINIDGGYYSVGSIYFGQNSDYVLIILSGENELYSNESIVIVNDLYEIEDVQSLMESAGIN